MGDQLPLEVRDFKDAALDALEPAVRNNHNQTVLGIEIADKQQKLKARKTIGVLLAALLFLQNAAVFSIAFLAIYRGSLSEIPTMLSIICTATLVETAAIVQIVVKWIFSDMQYNIR